MSAQNNHLVTPTMKPTEEKITAVVVTAFAVVTLAFLWVAALIHDE